MSIWRVSLLLFMLALALPAASQTVQLGDPPVYTGFVPKATGPESRHLYEPTGWIGTGIREAVRNAYLNDFVPTTNVPIGWTGNHATGDAGDSSLVYKEAAIKRINFFRAMAGAPAWVQLNLEFSRKAQQAAFMMSANTMLSHFPTPDWLRYTAEGAEAARNSNLCLSLNGPPDPGCVVQYMQDSGSSNFAVGHRRWILHPPTQEMGTGDVAQTGNFWYANSLWVFDGRAFDPRPPTRDGFVAWPPPGYVPEELIFDRWSFSYPGADFSGTTVAMERNGQPVSLQLEQLSQGFGENTIVWRPAGPAGNTANGEADVTSKITLTNVIVDGTPRQFTYDVIAFNPAVAGGPMPVFSAAGLVNSASFTAGSVPPDAWADLFGSNLASQFTLDSSFPTSIGGTSIMITDGAGTNHNARLHFVDPNRIQFLTPAGMASGQGSLKVTNGSGQSASTAITIASVRPGIFSANASGEGPAAATWLKIDAAGNRTGDFTFTLDTPRRNAPIDLGPATGGVYLAFFGTGFRHQTSVSCKLGGQQVPVQGAVAQGQFEGLDQAGVGPVPPSLAGRRDIGLECTFDGIPANVVTVSFR